ncbi:MAG: hypothetical protein ABJA66_09375 [Actinomycetota bacterium]
MNFVTNFGSLGFTNRVCSIIMAIIIVRFFLKQNPGSYAIKTLVDGEIARSVNLTIGKDGTFTDNHNAANNRISDFGLIVPAKVIPAKESAIDLLSRKTDTFYGIFLAGFNVS